MNSTDRPEPPKPKRRYSPPVLHVYGDIRAITRSVGMTGTADGGKGNMKRTRP